MNCDFYFNIDLNIKSTETEFRFHSDINPIHVLL